MFCAWQWPLLNDETYYWDWGRNVHLSYVDAPPAISWIAFLNRKIFPHGALEARFFVPFLNFLTGLFLLQSTKILAGDKEKKISYFNVIMIFLAIPIFNVNGIVLMPDAPLLFACSGSLYFALKACQTIVHDRRLSIPLLYALPLGLFIGLAIDSKYQGIPLSLGLFFAISCIRGIKNTYTKDLLFWFLTISCAIFVISPLLIWNVQHNFASFQFQGQHGLSKWRFNFFNVFIYAIGVCGILLPWYTYLFYKQVAFSFKQKNFFRSLDCIAIFSFLSIFLFIGYSALGKLAQEHWITPAFLFLLPLIGVYWDTLTGKKNIWRYINVFSLFIIGLISVTVFTRPVQEILSQNKKVIGFPICNIHNGLYHNFSWTNLKDPLNYLSTYVPEIANADKKNISNLNEIRCSQEPYLGSFSWRWASQFAFYLPGQPRVFAFDFSHSSYYIWRDDLIELSGCKFMIIGSKAFDRKELEKIMTINSIKMFSIPQDYTNQINDMVLIEGVLKDRKTLHVFFEKIFRLIRYGGSAKFKAFDSLIRNHCFDDIDHLKQAK